jgi:hypothetical protein
MTTLDHAESAQNADLMRTHTTLDHAKNATCRTDKITAMTLLYAQELVSCAGEVTG